MFNPFIGRTFRRAIGQTFESYDRNPRTLYIVYRRSNWRRVRERAPTSTLAASSPTRRCSEAWWRPDVHLAGGRVRVGAVSAVTLLGTVGMFSLGIVLIGELSAAK